MSEHFEATLPKTYEIFTTELLSRSGLAIENPVPILQFNSVGDFRSESNNFPGFFNCQRISELVTSVIQGRPVFKRFEVLFPFQTFYLQELTCQDLWYQDPQIWYELFDAYKIMASLVDENDAHVMRDGHVDSFYLIR